MPQRYNSCVFEGDIERLDMLSGGSLYQDIIESFLHLKWGLLKDKFYVILRDEEVLNAKLLTVASNRKDQVPVLCIFCP